jgi:hypothetical protein
MAFIQLNPTIPVVVTSKNNTKGDAIAWLDYSSEHYIIWGVALENGEVWWVPNHEIRMQGNWTMGRRFKNSENPLVSLKTFNNTN